MKHKLIAFEGIDGVGKTTLSSLLVQELNKRKIRAIRFEDFEDRSSGYNLLKPFINSHAPVDARLLFYLSSAVYKSDQIRRLLKKQWIVCDRYVYSTLAAHEAIKVGITKLVNWRSLPIIKPDYLFLCVVDELKRLRRAKLRTNASKNDFIRKSHTSVPYRLEHVLRSFNPIIIDNSSSSPDKALRIILAHVLGH